MFWRKQRAAIERFHPLHQQLIFQRTVAATMRPQEWAMVLASLAQHDHHVRRRKWQLPPRVFEVLVPLLRILSADAASQGAIGVRADLRGPAGKRGPAHDVPVPPQPQGSFWRQPPQIRRIVQWFTVDPWLTARAQLADGSVLTLAVVDQVRHRRVTKRNARGKIKTKTKNKAVLRVTASRAMGKKAAVRRPGNPPPRWIRVQVKERKRLTVRAAAKRPQPSQHAELDDILLVATEPFRWTPPAAGRAEGRVS